jgi:hypothetical protein
MKRSVCLGLSAAVLLAASNASAVVCAGGVVRGGCVAPHAVVVHPAPVVVHRPPVIAHTAVVVHSNHRCHHYVNGRRVCL